MKKRSISIALALVLVMSFSTFAVNAAQLESVGAERNSNGLLRYSYLTTIAADLEITSAGKALCYGKVKLSSGTTNTVTVTVALQQKSGSTWSTIKSWDTSGSGTVSLDTPWEPA